MSFQEVAFITLRRCQTYGKMAPVFSRLSAAPLPNDVLRMIASLLSPGDLRNFTILSKACHISGAPVLYRSIEAWCVPRIPFFTHENCFDNRPVEVLQTLIKSTLPCISLSIPSRCYAEHVVTLCYGSWSVPCDFRALPLLAEALRFTHRLRHLRIDVAKKTIPMVLDIFRRASIIITPSTMLTTSSPFDQRALPSLQSIRTSRFAIADALMQHRCIETVVVDLPIKEDVLAKFLHADPPWSPRHLRQLSLNIVGYTPPPGLIGIFLNAFPGLQHLAIHTSPAVSRGFMEDSLEILTNLPEVGQSFHTFSINHGSLYPISAPVLEQQESIFKAGFPNRPALKVVVMGMCMWTRKEPWLLHESEGEWGTLGHAIKAYYHDPEED